MLSNEQLIKLQEKLLKDIIKDPAAENVPSDLNLRDFVAGVASEVFIEGIKLLQEECKEK